MAEENAKRDIATIIKLSNQFDYSNKKADKQILKMIEQKDILKSAYGHRYIHRLEDIINGGKFDDICIICEANTATNQVVCDKCMTNSLHKMNKGKPRFCRWCGASMYENDKECPVCNKSADDGYEYCACCGNKVPLPPAKKESKIKGILETFVKGPKEN